MEAVTSVALSTLQDKGAIHGVALGGSRDLIPSQIALSALRIENGPFRGTGTCKSRRMQWRCALVSSNKETHLGGRMREEKKRGSLGDSEGKAGVLVHRLTFNADSSLMTDQFNVLKGLQTNTGLGVGAVGNSERSGRLERYVVAVTPIEDVFDAEGPLREDGLQMEAPWPLEWVGVSEGITIGSSPASRADLEKLVEVGGFDVIVSLQTEAQAQALGVQWEDMKQRAVELDCVAFRVPMDEYDGHDQAAALPEAVRVVSAVAMAGHRVYLACTTGTLNAPLVALGYLTFLKGMAVDDAVVLLKERCPGAILSHSVWEEARAKMSGGDMKRLTQLAEEELQQRISDGRAGDSANDWMVAQRRLVAESLQQRVTTDVILSQALSKAAVRRAMRAAERQVEETKATAEDRIALLSAQISHLEQKQATAQAASKIANDRIDFFFRQVRSLKEKEAAAKEEALVATNQIAGLVEQVAYLEARNSELENQVLRSGNGTSREETLSIEVAELREREAELKEAYKTAEMKAKSANERADELTKQLSRMEQLGAAANEAAATAKNRIELLTEMVTDLEKREAAAKQATTLAEEQLQVQILKEEEAQKQVARLSKQVEEMEKEISAAREATRAAHGRIQFFFRLVKGLKERESAALQSAKEAKKKLTAVTAEVMSLREANRATEQAWRLSTRKVEMLTDEMNEAVRLLEEQRRATGRGVAEEGAFAAKEQQWKRDLSSAEEREAALQAKLKGLERDVAEARKAVQAVEGRKSGLEKTLAAFEGREAEAKSAADEAEQQIRILSEQLEEACRRQMEAKSEANALAEKLAAIAEETKKAEDSEAEVNALRQQVSVLQQDLSAARMSSMAAVDRSSFLLRQMDALKRRQIVAEKLVSEKSLAEKVAILQEMNLVRESARVARAEAEEAKGRAEVLAKEMALVEERERQSGESLGAAEERIEFLFRQLSSLRKKETANKQSLAGAKKKMEALSRHVALLEKGLEEAQSQAGKSGELVIQLSKVEAELRQKLREKAQQVEKDQGASEISAQEVQQREEEEKLLSEVSCLREAVLALEAMHPNGGAADDEEVDALFSPGGMRQVLEGAVAGLKGQGEVSSEGAVLRSVALAAAAVVTMPMVLNSTSVGGLNLSGVLSLAPVNAASVLPDVATGQNSQLLLTEMKDLLQSLVERQAMTTREVEALMPLVAPSLSATEKLEAANLFCNKIPPQLRTDSSSKICNTLKP